MKEDKELYVYKFSTENIYQCYENIARYIKKNNCNACQFDCLIGPVFILDKNFGELLAISRNNKRPLIGRIYKKFIGKYKKRSINSEHKVYSSVGKDGGRLIKHYSESIINHLRL